MRSTSDNDDDLTSEERAMLDRAFALLLLHLAQRKHGRVFYASEARVEIVCARCGEVVFEGPAFDDPAPGFKRWIYQPEKRVRASRMPWQRRRRRGRA
jgi:hypothetical protein